MTYTADLTTVLKLLFDLLTRMPRSSTGISWSELEEAFKAYERSGSRRRTHHLISLIFQLNQQISADSFRCIFRELVEYAEVPALVHAPVVTSNPGPVAVPEPASGPSHPRRVPWQSAPQSSANFYARQDVSVPPSLAFFYCPDLSNSSPAGRECPLLARFLLLC